MNIEESYFNNIQFKFEDCDYCLVSVCNEIFVGEDCTGNVSVLIRSKELSKDSIFQKTRLLCIKTNTKIRYKSFDTNICFDGYFHIIKCFSNKDKEIKTFLKLCDTYFFDQYLMTDEILDVFYILNDFFSEEKIYSERELQGLFCELYTMKYYYNKFDFIKYWQSKDKLKFDFSINSKVKLEIKSTLNSNRIHKFHHDQLFTELYDIYILSFKLRYDDKGISLNSLLDWAINKMENYSDKKNRLLKVLYACSNNELDNIKYSEEYIIKNMYFYRANDVPHYDNKDGVTGAIYNSDFENIRYITEDIVLQYFNEIITNEYEIKEDI